MKKVFYYVICLQLIGAPGCNDNNKNKDTNTDSTGTVAKQDPTRDQMKSYFASALPGFNPQATIQNLSKYPDLSTKTKTVNFSYENVIHFIDSLDKKFQVKATVIYFVYGAYTPSAVNWYLTHHKTLTHKDSLAILNQPCLVIAYKAPDGQFIYASEDIGTICPPPNSCESAASYPLPFALSPLAGFDPGPTIANYNVQYQDGKNPIHPLTQRVRFDIAAIKQLDTLNGGGSLPTDIYFATGAYTSADADRYVGTHPTSPPNPPITASEIVDRTCLLLAFKAPNSKAAALLNYYDIGTICPPPNSCETPFVYKR